MSDSFAIDKTNKVRQLNEYARYDRETVFRILDAGLVADWSRMSPSYKTTVPLSYR